MRLQNCLMLVCLCVIWATVSAANAQEPAVEFIDLPSSLPSDHLRDTPLYSDSELPAQFRRVILSPTVFAGLTQHPRPNLAARAKLAVSEYEKHCGQYVRCETQDGRVIVGFVANASDKSFVLQTGFIAEKTIEYSALAAGPKPVAATGKKIVRGAEITGAITLVVVLLPIILPIYLFACVSGNCPD